MYAARFNTIFVHIPKTAGQSIEQVFLDRYGLSWDERASLLLRKNSEPQRGPARLAHLYAREYVECGHVSKAAFEQSFKFAVVRNPYDRTVSEYLYRNPSKRKSFPEFVDSIGESANEFSDLSRHVAAQSKFVHDRDGTVMVDAILRFESLEQDFRAISSQLFGEIIKLPHRNKSSFPVALPLLDLDTRQKIFRLYEEDFDLFRYPNGLEGYPGGPGKA
jgi:hypothetical protein